MNYTKTGDALILGAVYRDSVLPDIQGVAIAVTSWITGCDTVGLARVHEGEEKQSWVDITRLELVEARQGSLGEEKDPGGPHPAPQKANRR